MPRLSSFSLLFAVILCTQAPAQPQPTAQIETTQAKSETDKLVDQLIENAAHSRTALPSLVAHESIVVKLDEFVPLGKKTAHAEATVRLVRKSPDGTDFKEIRVMTRIDNHPITPDSKIGLKYDFTNDFDDFQSMTFNAGNRPCYSYTLVAPRRPSDPLMLSAVQRPEIDAIAECKHEKRGITATVLLDPRTHQILHLDTQFSRMPQDAKTFGTRFSADYASTNVGGKIFWLPTTIQGHFISDKHPWEWNVRFSDYHQYTSSVKLLPDSPAPAPDSN